MSKKQLLLPHCVGDYELGDSVCDGDPSSADSDDRAPCGWRDRCSALSCYTAETQKDISELVRFVVIEGVDYATPIGHRSKFEAMCDSQVARYNVKEGKPTRDPIGDPEPLLPKLDGRASLKPSKRAIRAARKALTARAKNRRQKVKILVDYFCQVLEKELRRTPYRWSLPRHVISHGKVYLIDRSETSGYVSIYIKNQSGRDVPLALLKFKTMNLTLDLGLPVEIGQMSKAAQKALKPAAISDGRFRCISKGLDKAGVALGAETVVDLIKSGYVGLPR